MTPEPEIPAWVTVPGRRRDPAGDRPVEIRCEKHGDKEKALLIYDGRRTFWVPKSRCRFDPVRGVLTLPLWLAKRNGCAC